MTFWNSLVLYLIPARHLTVLLLNIHNGLSIVVTIKSFSLCMHVGFLP